ncbi:MAG: hypothetical protein JXB19_01120 [Bacteroidales bacterium]|nr:hypothetical protein [Bacteroidales bacterium]
MFHKLKYFTIILLIQMVALSAGAQDFIWTAGNFSFFDNREYFNPYVDDQTIFGSRIYGYAGFSLNENNKFAIGIDYLYEFGSKGELQKPDFILFYQGGLKNLSFKIGAFPRHGEISMPLALMSDTIRYYRSNIEGISVEYNSGGFCHNVWIDWTSRQSYIKREIFMLGFSGYLNKGLLLYQHHFVMSHVAHSKNHDPDEHIRDNGGYSAMAGLDLSHLTSLDTLVISSGIMGSYDRLRNVYDFTWPVGWVSEADVNYKGFGLRGLYYTGGRKYNSSEEEFYGYYTGGEQIIISGDRFYRSGSYGRADVYYNRQGRRINGTLQFSLHFIPGIVDLSMSFVIRAQLNGSIPLRTGK